MPPCIEYINRYNTPDNICLRIMPMTARWKRGFEAAKKASYESDGRYPSERTGAAIYHGSRLLSSGCNQYTKTIPSNVLPNKFVTTIHAEQCAINKIRHYEYDAKLICYVVRVDTSGRYVVSKPCNMCIKYLQKHGVEIVRFINTDGVPEEMFI